jgi:membrane protease YdiL (CAAX protease family)
MSETEIEPETSRPVVATTESAPNFSAAAQPSYANTLFLGHDGLRPGWGVVFYFASYFALQVVAARLAWSHDFGASGLWSMLLEEFGRLLAALIPAVVLSRVERRPWSVYGLPATGLLGKRLWIGVLWGFAAVSLLMFALSATGAYEFGHLALHAMRIARFAVFWALMFLMVGLFEEFLSRGYAQFTLARAFGFWPAALVLSCGFGLGHLHNAGEQWPGLLAVVWIGLFFCLTLRRTGSLWFAVGFHAAWDWGETFFYSVPDSGIVFPGHLFASSLHGKAWLTGGTVGPEGSVLCFVVIALAAVAFDRACPRQVRSAGGSQLPIPNRERESQKIL